MSFIRRLGSILNLGVLLVAVTKGVLKGESLINDAAALTFLTFATATVAGLEQMDFEEAAMADRALGSAR